MASNSIKSKSKNELLNKFREPESEENDPFDEIEINMLESIKVSLNPGVIRRIKKKNSSGTRNNSAGSTAISAVSGDSAVSNSSSKKNTLNQNRQLKQQNKNHKEIKVINDNAHKIQKNNITESPKKTRLLNQFKEKNEGDDYSDLGEFQLKLDILSLKLKKKLSDERFPGHRNNNGDNIIDPQLLNKRIDLATFKQNFKITNFIGRGGYAVVHQVKYLKTNKFFAIKQLKIENEDKIKYLMEEIELMTILNHENIVNFYGYLRVEDNLNIILEYCSKGSLRNKYMVNKKGLPENEIRVYVKQILQGLKYVHEQGLIHRDIKAANILLDSNNVVKLADFGVATKVIDDPANTNIETNGSPYWMAPEVILLQGVFTSSDIWSLGATIIELLTTRPPFGEFNAMAACHAIGTHEEIPIPNNLSDNAVDFIEKCFQKSPSIRKSASELMNHQWFKMENEDFSKINLINNDNNNNEREYNDPEIRVEETGNSNLMKFQEKHNEDDIYGFKDFEFESTDDTKPLRLSNRFKTDTDFDIDDSVTNQSINNIDNKLEIKIKELVDRINKKNNDNNLEIFKDFDSISTELNLKDNKIMKNLIKNDFIFTIYLIMNNKALHQEKLRFSKLLIQLVNIVNIIFEIDFIGFRRFVSIGGLEFLLKIFAGQVKSIQFERGNKEFLTLINNITNNDELSKELLVINFPTYLIELFLNNENNDGIELVLINGLYNLFNNESISKKYLINVVGRNNGLLEKLSILILKALNSESEGNDQLIGKILHIILQFEQVNIYIKNIIINLRFLNNLLIIFNHHLVKFESKLTILRFINSISSNSKFTDQLNKLNCLGIFIDETKKLMNDSSIINGNNFNLDNVNDYRLIKSSSFILPILFNLCYLNNENQINLINYEFIPYLIELNSISKLETINNEIIKILCEIINNYNINNNLNYFNNEFNKLNLILFYFNLFNNYKWQINCIDSIIKLIKYDETKENTSSQQIALRYLLSDNQDNNNERDNIKQVIYKSIIISKNLDQFLEKLIELIDILKNDEIKFRIFSNKRLIEYLINKFNLNKINNNNNNNIQENVLILKFFKSLIGLKETRSTKSYSKLIKELYKIKIDYDNDKSNLSNKSVVIDQLLIEILLSKD
ncbi:hypothetical protein B5S33_g4859 [[Candida] boidinii]|nr:hypothetical protein B5S33_g4859 [[Candida] boidinii]GMF97715.1 unnamed protein product [[Candida] boidinii]